MVRIKGNGPWTALIQSWGKGSYHYEETLKKALDSHRYYHLS